MFSQNATATSSTAVPKIGVIGGSGPEAGLNVFKQLLDKNRSRMGTTYKTDKDAPHICMLQVPGIGGPHGLWDVGDRSSADFAFLWENMKRTVENMYKLDVDCFCITCNTLHVLEPDIRQYMNDELKWDDKHFFSIVDCTGEEIINRLASLIKAEKKQNFGNPSDRMTQLTSIGTALTSVGTPTQVGDNHSETELEHTESHSDLRSATTHADSGNQQVALSPTVTTPPSNTTVHRSLETPSNPMHGAKDSMTNSAAVAVLGTFLTSDPVESPYHALDKKEALHVVDQPLDFRNAMQKLIIDTKKLGPVPDLSHQLFDLISEMYKIMKKENDACFYFVMVLACSELPMLIDLPIQTFLREHNIQVVDPNSALCETLLDCKPKQAA